MSHSVSRHYGEVVGDVRVLDIAKGILIALRRYSAEHAFRELVSAAKDHQIGILALSQALVALAENPGAPPDPQGRATHIAAQLWSALFDPDALNAESAGSGG